MKIFTIVVYVSKVTCKNKLYLIFVIKFYFRYIIELYI